MAEEQRKILLVRKGTCLFNQNDTSRDLYIVKTGKLRVYKTEGGIDVDLDIAGPGAVVGEISALDKGVRSATVVALEDSELIVISAESFEGIVKKMPDWFQKIAKILVQRLRDVDNKIDFSKEGDKTMHVAAFIALLMSTELYAEGSTFVQQQLENEIADLLSMQMSEVSEVLQKLQKMGIISVEKNKVSITNRPKLEELGEKIYKTPPVSAPAI
jgi:CRP-like cAMP-binding protein